MGNLYCLYKLIKITLISAKVQSTSLADIINYVIITLLSGQVQLLRNRGARPR